MTLSVFVIGDGDLEHEQDIFVAHQHDFKTVMNSYWSRLSGYPPRQIVVSEYRAGEVLVTDSRGETGPVSVQHLIYQAQDQDLPAWVSSRDGMTMYLVDERYAVIAPAERELFRRLFELFPGEHFLELLRDYYDHAEFEFGCGVPEPRDPIRTMHPHDMTSLRYSIRAV